MVVVKGSVLRRWGAGSLGFVVVREGYEISIIQVFQVYIHCSYYEDTSYMVDEYIKGYRWLSL